MDRIWEVISRVMVRFAYSFLVVFFFVTFGSLVLTAYGKWSEAHPQLKITDRADFVRISWGPMYRGTFLGKSLFQGGSVASFFSQTYPVYFVAKDGSWEGIIVPETVLEHVVGRVQLLFSLHAEQPAFEVRRGKIYKLVLLRPTWNSGTIFSWEETVPSDDVAWVLQQSRGYLRHREKARENI